MLDLDGNFAIDHATEGSYAHVIMQEYLKKCSEYERRAFMVDCENYTLTRELLLVR